MGKLACNVHIHAYAYNVGSLVMLWSTHWVHSHVSQRRRAPSYKSHSRWNGDTTSTTCPVTAANVLTKSPNCNTAIPYVQATPAQVATRRVCNCHTVALLWQVIIYITCDSVACTYVWPSYSQVWVWPRVINRIFTWGNCDSYTHTHTSCSVKLKVISGLAGITQQKILYKIL